MMPFGKRKSISSATRADSGGIPFSGPELRQSRHPKWPRVRELRLTSVGSDGFGVGSHAHATDAERPGDAIAVEVTVSETLQP